MEYLTVDLNSWNNAKRAEEHERVKHEVDNYESRDNRRRFPNLVCMKISGYHKKRSDEVTLKTNYDNLQNFYCKSFH